MNNNIIEKEKLKIILILEVCLPMKISQDAKKILNQDHNLLC